MKHLSLGEIISISFIFIRTYKYKENSKVHRTTQRICSKLFLVFVDVYNCDAKSTFNVRQSTIQKGVGRSDEAKLDVLAVFQGVCGLVRLPYKAVCGGG